MSEIDGRRSSRAPGRAVPAVRIAVVLVAVLALCDYVAGSKTVVAGLLTVGPCIAAVSAGSGAVIAVGGYVVALVLLLSWPDRIWGTTQQALYIIAIIAVTAVSALIARRRARAESANARVVRALQASEARSTAILQSALDCVITMDSTGRVVEFNPAAERTFGYTRAEAIGHELADLIIPPVLRDSHRVGLLRYLSTGEGTVLGQHLELTAWRAGSGEFPVDVTITRVDLPGPPLFTGYLHDSSDRKRAAAKHAALEAQLHQSRRLESLGQLAGGVAHDFNNLLGAILNYAEFVAEETAGNPAVSADVAQIRSAGERAARLTRQLLIFARRDRIQPEILAINAAVSDVQNLLDRTIGEDVRLVIRLDPALPAIRADRGQIEQVLLNLAINARDAMRGGGVLTVETSQADLDGEQAGMGIDLPDGHYVRLLVSDTGVGMGPDVLARASEPFFTTKRTGEGSGLGLATVYGIVAESGGDLHIYSEPGVGTTVRAYFPAIDAGTDQIRGPREENFAQGQGETVLVVDDEAALREVVCRILSRNGYAVLGASGGDEALTIAASRHCDILLTDVVMPGMSGRDLAERLQERDPGLAVLFMSGYSQDVLGRRTLYSGAELIQKPFNQRDLLATVRTVLTRSPDPGRDPAAAGR